MLTGCFSSTPNSRFYLLESNKNAQPVSMQKFNIAVQDINVPEYLDRPQIVWQKPQQPELKIAEFDRWASDINVMLQNTMIENLQTSFPQANIKPLAYGMTSQYIIKINIEKMSGWENNDAYLIGNWQILNSRGKIISENTIDMQVPAGKTYGEYVSAQSKIWAKTSHEIAEHIMILH